MKPKLAAFPKCFMDELCVHRTMTVSQWIDLAATLGVDGLEFYVGFMQDDPALQSRILAVDQQVGRTIGLLLRLGRDPVEIAGRKQEGGEQGAARHGEPEIVSQIAKKTGQRIRRPDGQGQARFALAVRLRVGGGLNERLAEDRDPAFADTLDRRVRPADADLDHVRSGPHG